MGDAPPVTSGRNIVRFTAALSRKFTENFLLKCHGETDMLFSNISIMKLLDPLRK
jgi:hypothetical protein